MRNNVSDRQCPHCAMFLSKDEYHNEFDFFKHPAQKDVLRELRRRLAAAHGDVEQYATNRGLRNARGVVMPGYGRLIEAKRWLDKLEEPVQIETNLPL